MLIKILLFICLNEQIPSNNLFIFNELSYDEVKDIIFKFKNKNSCNITQLNIKLLRIITNIIKASLTEFLNMGLINFSHKL